MQRLLELGKELLLEMEETPVEALLLELEKDVALELLLLTAE